MTPNLDPSDPTDPPEGGGGRPTLESRRDRERRVWATAFILSVVVHLLALLLGPGGSVPLSPFAAAGPDDADDRAAEGAMQAVALSSAPPEPLRPPTIPDVDAEIPEPDLTSPDPTPEVELDLPDPPEPGVGTTRGDDPDEIGVPGLPGATGRGAAGTVEEGRSRLVPPSPRGMIIPPTNRDLREREVEVWVFVDERGRVVPDSTRLLPPTSDRRFNEQLIREAGQWVFEPARRDGEPVAAWFPYTISM